MVYLRNHINQALIEFLSHPKPTTLDDCIDEEAPTDSSSMWITKATIQLLDTFADRIHDRFDNLQATIVNIIDGATQANKDLCTELGHAKNTITSLKRELADAQDKMQEQANNYLELGHAKKTITGLKRELRDMTKARNT